MRQRNGFPMVFLLAMQIVFGAGLACSSGIVIATNLAYALTGNLAASYAAQVVVDGFLTLAQQRAVSMQPIQVRVMFGPTTIHVMFGSVTIRYLNSLESLLVTLMQMCAGVTSCTTCLTCYNAEGLLSESVWAAGLAYAACSCSCVHCTKHTCSQK